MKDDNAQLHTIEKELEEIIGKEITIQRAILNSLKREQNALYVQDFAAVDSIIEESIAIFTPFDLLGEWLKECTRQLAKIYHRTIPPEDDFSHSVALELLKEWLPTDEMEVHSGIEQLQALNREIATQNNVTSHFLRMKPLPEGVSKKKTALAVMERP